MLWRNAVCFSIIFFLILLNGESLEIVKYGDTVEIDCFEPDLANQHTDAFISLHIALPNAKPNEIVQYKPSQNRYSWVNSAFENNITILSSGKAQIKFYFMSNATISCELNSFSVRNTPTKSVLFVVIITPKTKINSLKQNFEVGSKLENVAECVIFDGNPNPEVNWIPVNHDLKFSQNKVVSHSSGLVTVTDVLQIKLNKLYNGKTFQCKASHPGFSDDFLSDVTLNIIYPPSTPKIRFDNTKSTLTCVADGNPPPTYEWTVPSSVNPISSQSVDIDSSKRNDVYSCIAMNSEGKSDRKTVTLNELLAGSTSIVIASVLTVIVLFALFGAAYLRRQKRIQREKAKSAAAEVDSLFSYDEENKLDNYEYKAEA